MAETQEKTWDVLGYTYEEPPGRVYRVGLTRDQIKELREDKYLRAYHMLPVLGDTKHETWLRNNRGSDLFSKQRGTRKKRPVRVLPGPQQHAHPKARRRRA
jgi:hypothetical protein